LPLSILERGWSEDKVECRSKIPMSGTKREVGLNSPSQRGVGGGNIQIAENAE